MQPFLAIQAVKAKGQEIDIITVGSENLGEFSARPFTSSPVSASPKTNPSAERVIGSFETEYLNLGGIAYSVAKQQRIAGHLG